MRKRRVAVVRKDKLDKLCDQLTQSPWQQAKDLKLWLEHEINTRPVYVKNEVELPKTKPAPKRLKVTLAQCPPPLWSGSL